MGKPSKNKKSKVPKISEEQYAEYISSLRGEEKTGGETPPSPTENNMQTDLR